MGWVHEHAHPHVDLCRFYEDRPAVPSFWTHPDNQGLPLVRHQPISTTHMGTFGRKNLKEHLIEIGATETANPTQGAGRPGQPELVSGQFSHLAQPKAQTRSDPSSLANSSLPNDQRLAVLSTDVQHDNVILGDLLHHPPAICPLGHSARCVCTGQGTVGRVGGGWCQLGLFYEAVYFGLLCVDVLFAHVECNFQTFGTIFTL